MKYDDSEKSKGNFPLRIPEAMFKKITEIASTKGIPKSHLILAAIDNELDLAEPFTYHLPEIKVSDEVYHPEEGNKLVTYLKELGSGINLRFLLFSRRDFGVDDRDVLCAALGEAIGLGLVEEYKMKANTYSGLHYGAKERFFRYVNPDARAEQKAKRRAELQRKLARLDEE